MSHDSSSSHPAALRISDLKLHEDPEPHEWHILPMEDALVDALPRLQDSIVSTDGHSRKSGRSTYRPKDPASKLIPSPICEFCDNVFTKPWLWGGDVGSQSIEQFETSAKEESCHLCRLRWKQLSPERQAKIREGWGSTKVVYFPKPGHGLSVRFHYLVEGDENAMSFVNMVGCQDLKVLPQQALLTSNDSRSSWALANFWLRCCEEHHADCQSLAPNGRRLPTRLVDLGPEPHIVRPRICHAFSLSLITKYTTLSHRWGEETERSKLTTDVEQPWSDALPLSKLPTIYKEAMEATKRLGMQYIWIDSLCILQDSETDWQTEAASMDDVYRFSACNLTAAAGTTKLFTTRSVADVDLCVVQPSNFLGTGSETTQYYCYDSLQWEININKNPLFSRGWVFQERLLAPRCLHFTGTQMFWECLNLAACESFPTGIPFTGHVKPSTNTKSLDRGFFPRRPHHDDPLKPYLLWERIVEDYTETALTFPTKDKLAALSGVAKSMGLPSEEYFAGIWRQHLVIHLLWKVNGMAERPQEYQAPSWSWASVNGKISMSRINPILSYEVLLTSLLSASVTPSGQDPTGPVLAGYVLLQGPIARVPPPRKASLNSSGFETESNANPGGYNEFRCNFDVSSDSLDSSESLFFLLISYRSRMAWGLLLTPSGRAEGEFFRRGRFSAEQCLLQEDYDIHPLSLFEESGDDFELRKLKRGADRTEDGCTLPMYEVRLV